jgi:hypothetical protein
MNIFIACDGKYYDQWGINCLKSIRFHVPWIKLTAHIVNPSSKKELEGVRYFYETLSFNSESSMIGYYQAVRFLKCAEYFNDREEVLSIDCDTVLTRPFSPEEFREICEMVSVQRHQKDKRWMAGLVAYGKNNFRDRFREELLSKPISDWICGWDQDVLEILSNEFIFKKLYVGEWMSFGRGGGRFLTLKGDQKTSQGYLNNYQEALNKIL